jgi:hypothetical protein
VQAEYCCGVRECARIWETVEDAEISEGCEEKVGGTMGVIAV